MTCNGNIRHWFSPWSGWGSKKPNHYGKLRFDPTRKVCVRCGHEQRISQTEYDALIKTGWFKVDVN